MRAPELWLRDTSPGLLALPWDRPLREWVATEVPLRDIPVGPSRHLVRFVDVDGRLWALKHLPARVARKEYAVLRDLESMGLPSVRAAGLVLQPEAERDDEGVLWDSAILVTHYLEQSWQYRRLFQRLPLDARKHRQRLLDAMATLLVELHRHGVFWGDCSLANTLFSRDGQVLQAWFVDAETSEVHPRLTDGQRQYDLDILVENVAGGMMDLVASQLEESPEDSEVADYLSDEYLIEEARSVEARYHELWAVLHAEPTFEFADRYRIEGQIRALQDLGFVVDEITLRPVDDTAEAPETTPQLRLKVRVGDRRFHAHHLRRVSGLDVGEGQASVLLGDLHAYHGMLRRQGAVLNESEAAASWLEQVVRPTMRRAHEALGGVGHPIQAYCDFLEVRWLLSEQAGRDVGNTVALEALAKGSPTDSAASMAVADAHTGQIPVVTDP